MELKVFVADGVELADHIVKEFQFVSGRIAVFSVNEAVVLGDQVFLGFFNAWAFELFRALIGFGFVIDFRYFKSLFSFFKGKRRYDRSDS